MSIGWRGRWASDVLSSSDADAAHLFATLATSAFQDSRSILTLILMADESSRRASKPKQANQGVSKGREDGSASVPCTWWSLRGANARPHVGAKEAMIAHGFTSSIARSLSAVASCRRAVAESGRAAEKLCPARDALLALRSAPTSG